MSEENYRSATKSHDPGWNDPPKLGYSPSSVASSGQTSKLNLNKRVAFPTSGGPPATASPGAPAATSSGASSLPQFVPSASLPPSSPSVTPSAPPVGQLTVGTPPKAIAMQLSKSTTNSEDGGEYPAKPEMLVYVRDTLEKCVLKLETSKQADIRKRLSVIEQSWANEKLGEPLQRKLYRLAQALTDGKPNEANEMHRSIVLDHGRDCVQWAPALRQLVMALPKQAELPNGESAEAGAILKPI
ncbi:steroid receptor RNA activator 1-like [Sabethes cyaneus]|uniref:steroid receptor RNA activator 1-like n=1 Tax=Sabethes cyaneus TaxID=53552 RepID=UPI00237D4B07|nr:steroid receptor RNA activator 1-like [Sabethes cyaneus]